MGDRHKAGGDKPLSGPEELRQRLAQLEEENQRLREEQAALHDTEKRLRAILESSPIAVGISRLEDSRILFVNSRNVEMFGAPVGAYALDHWADKSQRSELAMAFRRGEQLPDREVLFRREDGSSFWGLLTWKHIDFEGDDSILFWVYDIDQIKQAEATLKRSRDELEQEVQARTRKLSEEISVRRRVEEQLQREERALRVSEANLRITLDSIGDGVIATDSAGRAVRLNPAAERLCGWTTEDARGRPLSDVLDLRVVATGEQRPNPALGTLTDTDASSGAEEQMILVARDGRRRRVAELGAPIRNDEGETVGAVLVLRDVTEQHELEVQLRQAQRMDSIGQLAGGVAHDFNNMLAGIVGAAELLSLRVADEECQEMVEVILSAAERSADLTGKLLAFSREERSVSTPFDVHVAVADALALLERTVDRRVTIIRELRASETSVVGDASQIQSAVLNLGVNACHAMPEGGTLTVSTLNTELGDADCRSSAFDIEPGTYVQISVRDTGVGMTPEVQSRVFEPFFTTKAVGEGTGLGLAAVYGTVKDHRGAIRVFSEESQGAVFHLFLPVAEGTVRIEREVREEIASTGGCVLVVDDEPLVLGVAVRIFEELGCTVLTAEDGEEGLEMLRANSGRIDLVILDVVMPKMSGAQAFRAIRELDPNAYVVMCSGFTRNVAMAELKKGGLRGFIRKPFRRAELAKALRDALSR